jgi:hypothetical protein
MWQRLRLKYQHGIRTAYNRDFVRKRILSSRPFDSTDDHRCEIHVLTSHSDWLNLIWALKSFYYFSQRNYALCIHEDGSLSEDSLAALSFHFPRSRIIRRKEADTRVDRELMNFPRSQAFRRANLLAPKVFDFVSYLAADRMLLFDSDLLFFAHPTALLQRIEDKSYVVNTFNSDVKDAYAVDRDAAARAGYKLHPCVNSGLGLVHKTSVCWSWTEEFLAIPQILDGHMWRIEQTLFALCSSRFGVELLPDEYRVRLEPGIGSLPLRHYVGAIRHLMYKEGIARLNRTGFLTAIGG